jgi:cysteine-rich repeat protein
MNVKQRRRWWIGLISSTTLGLACADDELQSDTGIVDADGDDGMEAEGGGDESYDSDEPRCGNGRVDQGEACDDGNATDEDQCTSACNLPACGDGIVQADAGEACDDGNNAAGDGCTINCKLRGALLAEHTSEWFTLGTAVVVDSNDQIIVSGRAHGESWIAKFDGEFNMRWSSESLPGDPPGLAIGTSDELLLGGQVGTEAHAQRIDSTDGAQLWLQTSSYHASMFSSVAANGDHMVAAGYYGPKHQQDGLFMRHSLATGQVLTKVEWAKGPFGPLVVSDAGWVWVVDVDKEAQLNIYDAKDQLQSTYGLAAAVYEDIVVDEQSNAYLLGRSMTKDWFSLTKLAPDGTPAWPPKKYKGASASGLVLGPEGTVIVAGHTLDESNGLLVWYDREQGELLDEVKAGTDDDEGQYEVFEDIAIAQSGEFAVAVGGRGLTPDNTALWIYMVEL